MKIKKKKEKLFKIDGNPLLCTRLVNDTQRHSNPRARLFVTVATQLLPGVGHT